MRAETGELWLRGTGLLRNVESCENWLGKLEGMKILEIQVQGADFRHSWKVTMVRVLCLSLPLSSTCLWGAFILKYAH
jgi:hypothetical protein